MSRSIERALVGTLLAVAALGGVSSALQTSTTTETKTFEVVAVNGNALVVRNAAGTQEFIVPDTFRFTTAGKTLSVHELTPGMKGTATITTTTTLTPVTVTEVKQATVMQATPATSSGSCRTSACATSDASPERARAPPGS